MTTKIEIALSSVGKPGEVPPADGNRFMTNLTLEEPLDSMKAKAQENILRSVP